MKKLFLETFKSFFDPIKYATSIYRELLLNSPHKKICMLIIAGVIIYIFSVILIYSTSIYWTAFTALFFLYCLYITLAQCYKKLVSINLLANTSSAHFHWSIVVAIVFIYSLCTLSLSGIYMFPDTRYQWEQVQTECFNDWHPIVHTLVIWLFSKLHNSLLAVGIGFIFIYSLVVSWLYHTLHQYKYNKHIINLILAYIILNPITSNHVFLLLKDMAFAISVLSCAVTMIHLWHTNGKWLLKKAHFALFVVIVFFCTFLRHNGIFMTIPFLLLLPLLYENGKKKPAFIISTISFITIGSYIFIRTILIEQGTFQKTDNQFFGESVGVPMCMMSEVYVLVPEKCPENLRSFMSKIAPHQFWKENYKGTFNSIKWKCSQNWKKTIRMTTPEQFFSLFSEACTSSPRLALKGLRRVLGLGFNPFHSIHDTQALKKFFFNLYVPHIHDTPGLWLLLWVFCGGFGFIRHGWKVLPIVVPFMSYIVGTTLLLCGTEDFRFFYAMSIAILPTSLLCLTPNDSVNLCGIHKLGAKS